MEVAPEVLLQFDALPNEMAKKTSSHPKAGLQNVSIKLSLPNATRPPRWLRLPHKRAQHNESSHAGSRATSAIMQSTVDYWLDCWARWAERLGLREELMKDPVVELLRSAAPTEEERKQLQYQREWYYHDSSVFYVMLTVRLGLLTFILALLGFELLLQGWVCGEVGQALAVPRLFFSPAKAAELSFQGFATSGTTPTSVHPQRGSKRETLRRLVTGQVSCRCHQLLRRVLTLDDMHILESAGMDALMLLRFCALCGRFCALCGVWCLCLVPAYSAGERTEGSPGSLALYSLSNVPAGSIRLWLVVPTAYLCNLALCGLLWKEYEHFVKLRRSWLGGDVQDGLQSIDAAIDAAYDAGSRHLQTAARRAFSSPSLAPQPSRTIGPIVGNMVMTPRQYAAENPQNPNFSPPLRPGWSPSFGGTPREPHSPHVDINSIQINWSRGVTPPRLLCGGDPISCIPSGACSPLPPLNLAGLQAQPPQPYVQVSMDMIREQARRSVLLERVPPQLRDPGALRMLLEELLGPGSVVCVAFAPGDARRLSELQEERSALAQAKSSKVLDRLEDCLGERRHDFARAMTSSRLAFLRYGGATGAASFLSVVSDFPRGETDRSIRESSTESGPAPSATFPIRRRDEHRREEKRAQLRGSSTSSLRTTSDCSGWVSAAWLSCSTGCRALCTGLRTVGSVLKEVAGTSVRHVTELVPSSALETPMEPIGTPFGGLFPVEARQVSLASHAPEDLPSTAFITFRTLQAACVACQVVLDEDAALGTELLVSPAPEPRDVVWQNVARPQAQLLVRIFFVELALLFGLLFWSVPVSLIQVWCSMARLTQILPWLQLPEAVRGTELGALVTLYMPVLALLALLEVLPIVLHRIAFRYEGLKSWSGLQMLTMRRYWRFQLATIGVTVLSGSVSNSLSAMLQMLDQPTSLLWELGQSLPQVAVYFLATVLSSALVVGPVSLLRLPLLAQLMWAVATRRLRRLLRLPAVETEKSQFLAAAAEDCLDTPPMAADLSALLLVLLVCVTYAALAPLIIVAGALFFALRWLVLALRYLYVHVPRFDSGGAFWYLLWDQAIMALFLGDVATLAAVALRSGYAQLPFLLPLPLLPVAFRLRAEFRFAEPSRRLSLRAARTLDARADPNLADRFPFDAYWHPALRHPAHVEEARSRSFLHPSASEPIYDKDVLQD